MQNHKNDKESNNLNNEGSIKKNNIFEIKNKERKQKNKKQINFKSFDSLLPLEKVLNESSIAVKDKKRIIVNSSMPEVLGAVLGAGTGGVGSFMMLYTIGTVGLGAAGITSGLAGAGALASTVVGGAISPMVAGVFVLAAPVAILSVGGYATFNYAKKKKLDQEKTRLYQEALKKHDAIQKEMNREVNYSKQRLDYLNSLVILLSRAIDDLQEDLVNV